MISHPALYLRVSTNEQKVDAQEGEPRQYCERRGWSVAPAAGFRDESSGVAATRPGWDQLLLRLGQPERAVRFKEEILRLRAEGLSYQRIGARLGLSVGSVHRLCKLEGLRQSCPAQTVTVAS